MTATSKYFAPVDDVDPQDVEFWSLYELRCLAHALEIGIVDDADVANVATRIRELGDRINRNIFE